jgi:hypothetical protein
VDDRGDGVEEGEGVGFPVSAAIASASFEPVSGPVAMIVG